ncbi:MAG: CBS domain-containing protein, partial [bacterium]
VGAMLGGVLGTLFSHLAPGMTAGSGPYAMVGMAAVFSAAAHAPFSAIIILFELTGNYNIIIPLMISVVIATVLSNHFMHASIYTLKLMRRGVRLKWGANMDLLESIKVRDVMNTDVDTVREDMPKSDLYELFRDKRHNGFPVTDKDERLVGIVTMNDFYSAKRLPGYAPVDRFCTHNVLTVTPSDNLSTAMKRLRIRDIGRLPVVDEHDPGILLGIITRSDMLQAYELAMQRIDADEAEFELDTG